MFAPSRKRLRQLARDESTPTALQNVLTFAIIIVVCVLTLRLIGLSSHDKFNTASEAITPSSQADR